MRQPFSTAVTALAAAALGGALLVSGPSASAADPAAPPVRHLAGGSAAGRQEVRDFWTPERMRAAEPMERYLPRPAPLPPGNGKPWPGPKENVRTTGRLFLTLPGDLLASCSAAVVDSASKDVVATAGHCAHLRETGGWAERMLFVPGYDNGRRPYGEFPGRQAAVSRTWSADEDPDEDFAFIRLAPSPQGHIEDVVGAQPVSFRREPFRETVALGYPAAGPYDGESLQYCSGTARPSVFQDNPQQQYLTPCYFTEGSSGGPWYAAFDPETGRGVQTGVTSGKPAGAAGDAFVYAAMFDATAEELYRAVDGA